MTHLTPDELVDAVEGTLDASRRAHLASCAICETQVGKLSAILREAREVKIPEPSPLFWEHFSARVHAAIEHETAPGGGWTTWLTWPVLAPIAALAVIIVALIASVPRLGGPPVVPPSVSASASGTAGDVALADEEWLLVADMVGDMDWDTANAAGLMLQPGSADRAALELSAQEQQELRRLLTAELERAKS